MNNDVEPGVASGVICESRPGYADEMFKRTKVFALDVVRIYSALPKDTVAQTMGRQVRRSGTSVGAHYREGYRARSVAEFISKLEVAIQELEETCYWLELLVDARILKLDAVSSASVEAEELKRILVASVRTAKENRK